MNTNQRAAAEPAGPPSGRHPDAPWRMAAMTFPADKDFLALARTTAMHVAALLGLPISRVTDLRLAVDEACTAFLTAAAATGIEQRTLELRYDRYATQLRVSVRAAVPEAWPQVDELGWTMLQALVSEVRTEVEDGVGTLMLIEELPPAE